MKSMFKVMIVLSTTAALGNAVAEDTTATATATAANAPAMTAKEKKAAKKKKRAELSKKVVQSAATTSALSEAPIDSVAATGAADPKAVKEAPLLNKTKPALETISTSSSSATSSAPVSGTSTAVAVPTGAPAKKSPIIAQFNNYAYGSSLADPISNSQPDYRYGTDAQGIRVETHLVLGYRLSDNLSLSLNPQFESTNFARGSADESHNFMHPFSSYVKLGVGKFLQVGKFRWNGEFRYYPPVTDDLRRAKNADGAPGDHQELVHYLRVHQNFVYDIAPKWTIGAFNILRGWVRPGDAQNGKKSFAVESFLQVGYQAADSVNLSVGYDMYAQQNYGAPVTKFYVPNSGSTSVYTYLEPAVEWNATKFLTVYPYVDISTGEKISWKTSRLGLNVLMPIL